MVDNVSADMVRVLDHETKKVAPDLSKPYPVLCAWCLKNDNVRTVVGQCAKPDSHGICEPCNEKWLQKYIRDRRKVLTAAKESGIL